MTVNGVRLYRPNRANSHAHSPPTHVIHEQLFPHVAFIAPAVGHKVLIRSGVKIVRVDDNSAVGHGRLGDLGGVVVLVLVAIFAFIVAVAVRISGIATTAAIAATAATAAAATTGIGDSGGSGRCQ
jgi:hypothetical protein